MFTIFSIPKPFTEKTAIIQKNAIQSWSILRPKCEIILLGDEKGVAEIAHECKILHIPQIKKTHLGTPLLDSAFDSAQKLAKNDILMYVNTDIILGPDLIATVSRLNKNPFLVCGRRWDIDIKEEIDFSKEEWLEKLKAKVKKEGRLHGPSGLDYFIFPRDLIQMPPFIVGRQGWDNWLVYDMRSKNIPVIDATESITIIHQIHDYSHSKFEEKNRVGGPEVTYNIKLAGGLSCLLSLRDADWLLTENGLVQPRLTRKICSSLSLFYPWRILLAAKRKMINYLRKICVT